MVDMTQAARRARALARIRIQDEELLEERIREEIGNEDRREAVSKEAENLTMGSANGRSFYTSNDLATQPRFEVVREG